MRWKKRFLNEESGQGLTEYALLLVLIAAVVASTIRLVTGSLDVKYLEIIKQLPD